VAGPPANSAMGQGTGGLGTGMGDTLIIPGKEREREPPSISPSARASLARDTWAEASVVLASTASRIWSPPALARAHTRTLAPVDWFHTVVNYFDPLVEQPPPDAKASPVRLAVPNAHGHGHAHHTLSAAALLASPPVSPRGTASVMSSPQVGPMPMPVPAPYLNAHPVRHAAELLTMELDWTLLLTHPALVGSGSGQQSLGITPLEWYRFCSKRTDLRVNDWPDLTAQQQEQADLLKPVRTCFPCPWSLSSHVFTFVGVARSVFAGIGGLPAGALAATVRRQAARARVNEQPTSE
jgi:hypothetical protein